MSLSTIFFLTIACDTANTSTQSRMEEKTMFIDALKDAILFALFLAAVFVLPGIGCKWIMGRKR